MQQQRLARLGRTAVARNLDRDANGQAEQAERRSHRDPTRTPAQARPADADQRRRVEGGVVQQDLPVTPHQRRGGHQAEVVAQPPTELVVAAQRLYVVPEPVLTEHDQLAATLAVRRRGERRFSPSQRGIRVVVQCCRGAFRSGMCAPFCQALDVRSRPGFVTELVQGLGHPHCERRFKRDYVAGLGAERGEPLELGDVHPSGRRIETVARSGGRDPQLGDSSQRLAQLGHVDLDRVAGGARCRLAPHSVDQGVGRHDSSCFQREHRQHGALLGDPGSTAAPSTSTLSVPNNRSTPRV